MGLTVTVVHIESGSTPVGLVYKDFLVDDLHVSQINNLKKYDNKVTDIGNTLSDMINNGISGGLEKTFKVVEKLIE